MQVIFESFLSSIEKLFTQGLPPHMSRFTLLSFFAITLAMIGVTPGAAQPALNSPELEQAKAGYEGLLAVPLAKLGESIKARAQRYADDLRGMQERATASGQTDTVLALREELAAAELGDCQITTGRGADWRSLQCDP